MLIDLDGNGVENLFELVGQQEAVDWLRGELQYGPAEASKINQAWKAQNGSMRHLSIAQQLLGVEIENIEGFEVWKLPDKS